MNRVYRPIAARYDEVPESIAQEIARVGIAPFSVLHPIGKKIEIAGQPFVVTGYATREEFIATATGTLGDDGRWTQSPEEMHYHRLTTD